MLVPFCRWKNKVIGDEKAISYCFKIKKCDGLKLTVKKLKKGGARIESFQQADMVNIQKRKRAR
ncbi:MAG TPA: hypothetical protein VJC01_01880 [Candidatus Paceibacterota bacterium]